MDEKRALRLHDSVISLLSAAIETGPADFAERIMKLEGASGTNCYISFANKTITYERSLAWKEGACACRIAGPCS